MCGSLSSFFSWLLFVDCSCCKSRSLMLLNYAYNIAGNIFFLLNFNRSSFIILLCPCLFSCQSLITTQQKLFAEEKPYITIMLEYQTAYLVNLQIVVSHISQVSFMGVAMSKVLYVCISIKGFSGWVYIVVCQYIFLGGCGWGFRGTLWSNVVVFFCSHIWAGITYNFSVLWTQMAWGMAGFGLVFFVDVRISICRLKYKMFMYFES